MTKDEGPIRPVLRHSGFFIRHSLVIGGAFDRIRHWPSGVAASRLAGDNGPPDGRNPMRPLRIAVLDEELPFPPTSGKRIRTFNLLARLADRHRITVLCHRNPD